MMPPVDELLHADAKALWLDSLGGDDRVVVIGASGWFGRTASALLDGSANPAALFASRGRSIEVGQVTVHCQAWDWEEVQAFAPTVVVDCAFLTRDLVGAMDLHEYVERNSRLTENMLKTARLDSVSRVITISSGAAVFPADAVLGPIEDNPYGWLKRQAEAALAEVADERGIGAVVARAWSVSGAFVQKPALYALTDMIMQAMQGSIRITANSRVYRRYTAVDDLLAVALAHANTRGFTLIDSGGQLVEMEELAKAIRAVVNPAATISRADLTADTPNRYYAAPESWEAACADLSFRAATLEQQIRVAQKGLQAHLR